MAKQGYAAHGQRLETPFQSGFKKPQGVVARSRTSSGDTSGTQSTYWEQTRQISLELAK